MRYRWVMPWITALGLALAQPSHVVQKGDTLYSIARKYGTTVERISELNGLSGNALEIGQTLRLPTTVAHVVQKGDTLFSIAKRYSSSVEAIQRENKLGGWALVVGNTLKVPTGLPQAKPTQPEKTAAQPAKPSAQTPQAVQVVQPKPPAVGEEGSEPAPPTVLAPSPSAIPISTAKPDLVERTNTNPTDPGLPKPPPKGQAIQLVNPQALPLTVVTLPEEPSPGPTSGPVALPKPEVTAPALVKAEVKPEVKEEIPPKTEPSAPKEETKADPQPKVELPKEEPALPKQPSASATGDYNPTHPLMPVVLKYLGTPYVFGANSDRAVDCSAFVQQVLADLGLKVPRTSREQWAFFPATIRPVQGDLVFFSFGGKQIDHVGIYLGRNVFVHANSYESRVVIESLDAPTYKRVYRGSRSTNLGQVLAVSNGH